MMQADVGQEIRETLRHEQRIDEVEKRLNCHDTKLATIEERLSSMAKLQWWQMGMLATILAAIIIFAMTK